MKRILIVVMMMGLVSTSGFAIQRKTKKSAIVKRSAKPISRTVRAAGAKVRRASFVAVHQPASHLATLRNRRRVVFYSPWTEPTFADSTVGDHVDGEDLIVRRAAVQALGPYNGSIVVVDPQTGRILSLVNQNLAFKSGFQPCSTIKLVAALGGLNEGIIDRTTALPIGRRARMDLTTALAHSNNFFFATIGNRLGFDRVTRYARMLGLGEKACLNCQAEQPGTLPDAPPADGGVGMMTSFGSGINLTPLQLASLVTAIANGGTLYHLQHPQSQEEALHFTAKAKRQIDTAQWISEIRPGMEGAVDFGTARRASYNQNEPIFGKTGTCSDIRSPGIHLGWFGSFNETGNKRLVVAVLLTGGRPINGPVASGVAGAVYRNLSQEGYFGPSKVAGASYTMPVTYLAGLSQVD